MATQILAAGYAAANSSDQTVDAGGTAVVFLKPASGTVLHNESHVYVAIKTSAGAYIRHDFLGAGKPTAVEIAGPVTFRVERDLLPQAASCGVEIGS
jgi:hypothetical protein